MKVVRRLAATSILAAVTVLGFAGSAASADRPDIWTGGYIGAHAGYMWGNLDWQYVNPAGPAGALSREPTGALGGIHVGVQKRWGNIVLGVEGAWSEGRVNDRGPDAPAFAANFDARTSLEGILSIGPHIGWAHQNWMLYGTGGYARARLLTTDVVRATNTDNFKDTQDHNGWFLGGGVEVALTQNWIFGVEYIRYDFGSERHFQPFGAIVVGGTRDVEMDANVIRARLSFRVGAP